MYMLLQLLPMQLSMIPVVFQRVIDNVLHFTNKSNSIVTIGIKSNSPETEYGYVEAAEDVDGRIYKVAAFKEKPNFETAGKYLTAGNYLWDVDTVINAIKNNTPQIAGVIDQIIVGNDVKIFKLMTSSPLVCCDGTRVTQRQCFHIPCRFRLERSWQLAVTS